MPHLTDPLDADAALAQGLAWHLQHWARKLGADDAAADQVGTLGTGLVQATRQGPVCLPLAQLVPGKQLLPRAALLATGVIGTPAAPGACPLILDDDNRIYLHRDFDLEQRLARRLLRAARAAPQPLTGEARTRLAALFPRAPGSAASVPDWQQVATALALRQRLLVISGGPGTGKTSTVVKLLACLLAEAPQARIALTAPTGKAAARLAEAVRDHAARHAAQWPAALRLALPLTASTVHRLLGVTPQGFVHHAGRLLALDAVIVDEASMLDLALATHLLEAIPDSARIVLLGDQHQLAAVESGAVFAELSTDPSLGAACRTALEEACALPPGALQAPAPGAPAVLQDSVVWLERNYRFAPDSAIGCLATQIKHGKADAALSALRSAHGDELRWHDDAGATPAPAVQQEWQRGYAHFLQAVQDTPHDGAALAQAFARFRVLCAHREGARGMAAVNAALDAHAQQVLAPLLAHHPGA
ncbi:MAG: AAA family ATPase, partial [Rubrivivax sp.]|nr:AAA family ATPase [Rubrivivax sp.]